MFKSQGKIYSFRNLNIYYFEEHDIISIHVIPIKMEWSEESYPESMKCVDALLYSAGNHFCSLVCLWELIIQEKNRVVERFCFQNKN